LNPDLIPSSKVRWSKKIEYSFVIELQITALKEVLSLSLDRSRDNPSFLLQSRWSERLSRNDLGISEDGRVVVAHDGEYVLASDGGVDIDGFVGDYVCGLFSLEVDELESDPALGRKEMLDP
jgi:hypothetical protein